MNDDICIVFRSTRRIEETSAISALFPAKCQSSPEGYLSSKDKKAP